MQTKRRGVQQDWKRSIGKVLLALCLSGFSVSAIGKEVAGGASRPWPLTINLSLSSSFGEFRNGHIHAGVDIRTQGREGIPCRAVGDGSISRLRASPSGYGKALYLKLETGETAVYAHLSEFSPTLEEYLCASQAESETYTVDCSIPAAKFRVKEGEIIGFSGSTGTPAPHLHFEVRDVRENPVNPLSRGWTMIDERRPEPRRILWIPLDEFSLIDGSIFPQEVALRGSGAGVFTARDTLSITGSAGLGIDAIDRSDGASGELAPYSIEMTVDGAPAARIEREWFSYAQTGEVSLEYEMERVRTLGKHFLLLFEREGETQENRRFANGGIIGGARADSSGQENPLPIHTALIRILDKNGNESLVSVPFRIVAEAEAPSGSTGRRNAKDLNPALFSTGRLLRVSGRYSFQGWIGSTAALWNEAGHDAVDKPPAGLNDRGIVSLDAVAGRPFRLGVESPAGMSYVYCTPVRAGEVGALDLPDLGVSLLSRTDSFFSDAFVCLSPSPEHGAAAPALQQLKPLTQAVFFGPWSTTLRSRLDLAFALDRPPTGREAVYRWNSGSGNWHYHSSQSRGDTVVAAIGEPGVYRVFADEGAPAVGPPVLARHTMYGTGATYPEIVFDVADAGSGVDDSRTELFLDGDRVIGRYDPFRKKMFILLRQENIIGDHVLEVVARDRTGNESRLRATLNSPVVSHPDSLGGVK